MICTRPISGVDFCAERVPVYGCSTGVTTTSAAFLLYRVRHTQINIGTNLCSLSTQIVINCYYPSTISFGLGTSDHHHHHRIHTYIHTYCVVSPLPYNSKNYVTIIVNHRTIQEEQEQSPCDIRVEDDVVIIITLRSASSSFHTHIIILMCTTATTPTFHNNFISSNHPQVMYQYYRTPDVSPSSSSSSSFTTSTMVFV